MSKYRLLTGWLTRWRTRNMKTARASRENGFESVPGKSRNQNKSYMIKLNDARTWANDSTVLLKSKKKSSLVIYKTQGPTAVHQNSSFYSTLQIIHRSRALQAHSKLIAVIWKLKLFLKNYLEAQAKVWCCICHKSKLQPTTIWRIASSPLMFTWSKGKMNEIREWKIIIKYVGYLLSQEPQGQQLLLWTHTYPQSGNNDLSVLSLLLK